jgi:site-specific recombinase XerC
MGGELKASMTMRMWPTRSDSFPSQIAMSGGNLKDLQAVLGHSDIRTTMRYTHEDLSASMRTIQKRGIVKEMSKVKIEEQK